MACDVCVKVFTGRTLFGRTMSLVIQLKDLSVVLSMVHHKIIRKMFIDLFTPSGIKRHTFKTSCQVLTSIHITKLTPCCSLFVYNYVLIIAECLKMGQAC